MLDTVKTALEEHTQRGTVMSRSTFIKLTGWALMLGSLAVMLGWLASTRPEYHPNNARSLAIDQVANTALVPLWVSGTILLSVGYIGLLLRYGTAAGIFGRLSLGVGMLGGLVSAAGVIAMSLFEFENAWEAWLWGMLAQFLGLMLFGIVNLRQRTLPRWNGLPLLAGILIPLFTVVNLANQSWDEPFPDAVLLTVVLVSMGGIAALGYLLQSDSPPAVIAAPAV